jgi:hypothetical protein
MVKVLVGLFSFFSIIFCVNAANIGQDVAIKIPLQTNSISLDPAHVQDLPSLFVSRQINCQLIRNEGSIFKNDVAKSIQYLSPRVILITLNPDAKFHDGSPVTAQDVYASFQYIRKSRNVMRNIFLWVDRIEVKNQSSLLLHLNKSVPQILKVLSSPNYAIFKESFIVDAMKKSSLWDKPLGCGDYKISYSGNDRIELSPIKNTLPVIFYLTPDNQIRSEHINEFDIVGLNVSGDSVSLNDYDKIQIFDPSHVYIGLNLKNKSWKKREDRCAFLSKIKTESIVSRYKGKAITANDFLPVGALGYMSDSKFLLKLTNEFKDKNGINIDSFCLSYLMLSIPKEYRQEYFTMVERIYPSIKIIPVAGVKKFGSGFAASGCHALIFSLKSNYLDGYEYLQIFANNDANFSGISDRGLAQDIKNSQNHENPYERANEYRKIINKIENSCIILPLVTIPMRTIYVKKNLLTPGIGLGSLNEYPLSKITLRP